MRKFTKILLPLLCVVALLTCTIGSLGVVSVSANASEANSILAR